MFFFYLFNGGWSDFADAVNVVVNEALVIAPESFRPEVGSPEVSVRILNALHVGPFADQTKSHVQRQTLQLIVNGLSKRGEVDLRRNVDFRVGIEDVARSVVDGVQVGNVAPRLVALRSDQRQDVVIERLHLGVVQ